MADSKFAQLLAEKKIDPRRVIAASHKLETLQPEDRAIRLAKRRAKGGEGGEGAEKKETRKPRSGRPVTQRALRAALSGHLSELSGPIKTRLLRAVNAVLEQKKQPKVDLKALL
jgi:hypothetical protein